jgi:signal transduction histidine kinase
LGQISEKSAMAKKQNTSAYTSQTLRQRAEQMVRAKRTDITKMPANEIDALVFELQVNQIELQLQNAELNAARQEAERRSLAKDQFLAMVSHELRTPLTPIVAWSRLLSSEKLDDANHTRALESVERNASLLSQLIEDLLDISGFMAGKIRLEFRPVDLAGIANSAVGVVRHDADHKEIQIETKVDANIGSVSGDSERLQQVIWNLLSNAIKFTPERGRVTLQLDRLGSDIEITVSDTGRGISADFLPHVFDPFRQAEEISAKGRRGLGLGLAIVRQIIQMHGGTVNAASSGEGKGATFVVRFPAQSNSQMSAGGSFGQPRPAA